MDQRIPEVRFQDPSRALSRMPGLFKEMEKVVRKDECINGSDIPMLEAELASFIGMPHCVSCSSGTDALLMMLMALDLGAGQGVIVPDFTFAATAEVVLLANGVPVLADIDETSFNVTASSVARALRHARSKGISVAGVIAVDLFGLPAEYEELCTLAEAEGLWIISDCAQGFGASIDGDRAFHPGLTAIATSFYPNKVLGAFGDGGAVFTRDRALKEKLSSIREHGKGNAQFDFVRIGLTARLDTVQAVVLRAKLTTLEEDLRARTEIAAEYSDSLAGLCAVPVVPRHVQSAWGQYTLKVDKAVRDDLVQAAARRGVQLKVYYRRALRDQPIYKARAVFEDGPAASRRVADQVVSLPNHPHLTESERRRVVDVVQDALAHAGS